jgi:hypothetical protein
MPRMNPLRDNVGGLDQDTDPRVAAALRLLHHRRVWAWILAGSVTGLAADIVAGIFASTGAAAIVSRIALAGFIVLAVIALLVVITGTGRWWFKVDPMVRAQVIGQITHHSLAAHALRASGLWVARGFLWLLITAWLAFALFLVPAVVNSVAYLAHVGPTATFVAQSHTQECGRGGCYYVTGGVLETSPPFSVTWPDDVPLGSKFGVRRPVWGVFGYSHSLLNAGDSIFTIVAGVVVDGLAALVIVLLVSEGRRKLRARHQAPAAQSPAAGGQYPAWLLRRNHR